MVSFGAGSLQTRCFPPRYPSPDMLKFQGLLVWVLALSLGLGSKGQSENRVVVGACRFKFTCMQHVQKVCIRSFFVGRNCLHAGTKFASLVISSNIPNPNTIRSIFLLLLLMPNEQIHLPLPSLPCSPPAPTPFSCDAPTEYDCYCELKGEIYFFHACRYSYRFCRCDIFWRTPVLPSILL